MLTPEQLALLQEHLVPLYQELEDFIIKDIARRLKKTGQVTDTAKWQAEMANDIGISMKKIQEEAARINEVALEEVEKLFHEAALDSLSDEIALYEKAGMTPLTLDNSPLMRQYLDAAIKQTQGELRNLTGSLGFAMTVNGKVVYKDIAKTYHNALDLAQMQVLSGVTDYNTAVKQAVKKLCDSGLRYVNYESGWSNHVDVAVRRATLTGANQMATKMTEANIDYLGIEYVETTAHTGARPDHQNWQGQVFSYKGNDRRYPDFVESTGYGRGDGICGYNCRHTFHAFIPGVSVRAYSDKHLARIKEKDEEVIEYNNKQYNLYQATQQQRKIETAMRKTKCELIAYNKAGLKDEFTQASIKLQRQKQYYREFSKAAGLPLQNERHQVYGFNRSVAQKAVQSENKAYLSRMKSLGVENPPKTTKKMNELKVSNPKEHRLLEGYINAVEKGDISPLIGFNKYKEISEQIEEKLVGVQTKNGIIIKDYSMHFIDRIIGQYIESDTVQTGKRKGVPIEDALDTLLNPIKIGDAETNNFNGKKSVLINGNRCDVSFNPDTSALIQTNPSRSKSRKGEKR